MITLGYSHGTRQNDNVTIRNRGLLLTLQSRPCKVGAWPLLLVLVFVNMTAVDALWKYIGSDYEADQYLIGSVEFEKYSAVDKSENFTREYW